MLVEDVIADRRLLLQVRKDEEGNWIAAITSSRRGQREYPHSPIVFVPLRGPMFVCYEGVSTGFHSNSQRKERQLTLRSSTA